MTKNAAMLAKSKNVPPNGLPVAAPTIPRIPAAKQTGTAATVIARPATGTKHRAKPTTRISQPAATGVVFFFSFLTTGWLKFGIPPGIRARLCGGSTIRPFRKVGFLSGVEITSVFGDCGVIPNDTGIRQHFEHHSLPPDGHKTAAPGEGRGGVFTGCQS